MDPQKRVALGVGAAVGQVVASSVLLFLFYGYLRGAIGPERFGVWSVVLATALAGQVAGLGLSGAALKFVAQHRARGDDERAARCVETAALATFALLTASAVGLYPLLHRALGTIISEAEYVPEARAILPYALVTLVLGALGATFQAALDGTGRVDLRSGLVVVGNALTLGLSLWLVPAHGLGGAALAQTLSAAASAALAWGVLRTQMRLPLVPWRWSSSAFREMIGYGLSFQAVAVAMLLLDPLAKAFAIRFGGAAFAGNFEVANKVAVQARSLIVNAQQALVPFLTTLHERAPGQMRDVYIGSYRAAAGLVALGLPLGLALTPLLSEVWLGRQDVPFAALTGVLLTAWFFNVLSGPAYFANLSTGELRWNVASHVVMGAGTATLGWGFGQVAGGFGVAMGYAAAIAVGSALTSVTYRRAHGIRLAEAVGPDELRVGAGGVLGGTLAMAMAGWGPGGVVARGVGAVLVFAAVAAPFVWRHPARAALAARVRASRTPAATGGLL